MQCEKNNGENIDVFSVIFTSINYLVSTILCGTHEFSGVQRHFVKTVSNKLVHTAH